MQVRERIDFFFGDANFRRDKFLRQKTQEGKDRYVPISVLLTFNTLKSLTEDVAVVVAAAATSETVEVNETGDSLRRKCATLPEKLDDRLVRIVAKGLPMDTKWQEVREAFNACGRVTYVTLRRDRATRAFVGSAFVDFRTEAGARKAVTEPPLFRGEKLREVQSFQLFKRGGRREERRSTAPSQNRLVLRLEPIANDASFKEIRNAMETLAETHATTNVRPKFVDIVGGGVAFVRFSCEMEEAKEFVEVVKTKTIQVDGKTVSISTPSETEIASFWERASGSSSNHGRGEKRRRGSPPKRTRGEDVSEDNKTKESPMKRARVEDGQESTAEIDATTVETKVADTNLAVEKKNTSDEASS